MKNINLYISEKLIINKNTKDIEFGFTNGDPIFRIFIYRDKYILSQKVYYFHDIKNNHIRTVGDGEQYISYFDYEKELIINSNGYCEALTDADDRAVYLNKDDAIKFLDDLFAAQKPKKPGGGYSINAVRNVLQQYFDKSDTIPTNIIPDYSTLKVDNLYYKLKKL